LFVGCGREEYLLANAREAMAFDCDGLKRHLQDFLWAREPIGPITDAQDEHLMVLW
jgi:hypothetical protein